MLQIRIKILLDVFLVLRRTDLRKKTMMPTPINFKSFLQNSVIEIYILATYWQGEFLCQSQWEVSIGAVVSGFYSARHRYLRRSKWRRKTLRNKVRKLSLYWETGCISQKIWIRNMTTFHASFF